MGSESGGVTFEIWKRKIQIIKTSTEKKAKDKKTRESMFFQVTTEIVKAAISQKSAEAADIRE